MFLLMVTWFTYNQAPHSYQTTFMSAPSCAAAREQVIGEAARLKADSDAEVRRRAQQGQLYNPFPNPDGERDLR